MPPREILYVFDKTHDALAGEKALLQAGLDVRVMTRPSTLGDGCGICLRVDEDCQAEAEDTFHESDVRIGGIYLKYTVNGKSVYQEWSSSRP